MKAVHGNAKSRKSLASIYAIYSILYYYKKTFIIIRMNINSLVVMIIKVYLTFCHRLYGGTKLQNHTLNSRVNGEFRNKFPNATNDLIINNNGKYLLHIDYLYVNKYDISKTCCKIIEKYIKLLEEKRQNIISNFRRNIFFKRVIPKKKKCICKLLSEDAEARIFEIISYVILKNHYKNKKFISATH